jgi:hypothetical protein
MRYCASSFSNQLNGSLSPFTTAAAGIGVGLGWTGVCVGASTSGVFVCANSGGESVQDDNRTNNNRLKTSEKIKFFNVCMPHIIPAETKNQSIWNLKSTFSTNY